MTEGLVSASVVEATMYELAAVAVRAPEVALSSLAAAALELAKQLDSASNSATSKSMCAKELRETMGLLRAMVPEEREESPLDEIRARRTAKLAAG